MDKNVKMALIIGGIVLAILVILPLVFGLVSGGQGYGYGMMGPGMMGGGMMGGFGWGWFTPIISLLWIVLLGLIIWAVVSFVGSNTGGSSRADSALEVLKKRYARGEINKEEYEEKKKDLE